LYFRDGSLFAQRFDEKALAFDGPAMPLGVDAQAYWPTGSSAHAAAGPTLAAFPWPAQRLLRWAGRDGQDAGSGPPGDYYQIRISPDGRKVAATVTDRRTGVSALSILDIARKTLTRASYDKLDHDSPVWSPDGRQIVFTSDVGGPPHLFVFDIASGKTTQLLPVTELQFPFSWTADGRIFYQEIRPSTRSDIVTVPGSGGKPADWLSTPFNESDPVVSPDGRWVVFISDESGSRELYAAPIDRPREAVRLTTGGGNSIRWSRDGREIYFLRGPRDVYALAMKVEGDSIAAAEPVHLFTNSSDIRDYDVDRDGRFVIAQLDRDADNLPLTVLVNWQAALEKK
jgi:Tol biopolymer transport system component